MNEEQIIKEADSIDLMSELLARAEGLGIVFVVLPQDRDSGTVTVTIGTDFSFEALEDLVECCAQESEIDTKQFIKFLNRCYKRRIGQHDDNTPGL